jgi:hypothetical protein
MKKPYVLFTVFLVSLITILHCSGEGPKTAEVLEEDGKIYIVDDTGKKWDVTHAKEKYGMNPEKFQFGIGLFAIKPFIEPQMLTENDAGYPAPQDDFAIVGFTFEGESRAYPLDIMQAREVSNEIFGGAHLAITY